METTRAPSAGRVAVVTGGAKGIGRATVDAFVAEGAMPVLFDRDEAALAAYVKAAVTDAGFAAWLADWLADDAPRAAAE
jgi:NAD(P)-dependent dehydrogenase (short-subunit alcohol dehydrogenase family)